MGFRLPPEKHYTVKIHLTIHSDPSFYFQANSNCSHHFPDSSNKLQLLYPCHELLAITLNSSLFRWVGKPQQALGRVANNQQVYWICQQVNYFKTLSCWDFVLWRVCLCFDFAASFVVVNFALAHTSQKFWHQDQRELITHR